MRIELDLDLAKLLDNIKRDEPLIYGRGHVDTLRFLANYYKRHRLIEGLLNDFEKRIAEFFASLDTEIENSLDRVMLKALSRVIVGVLKAADENHPERAAVEISQGAVEGR